MKATTVDRERTEELSDKAVLMAAVKDSSALAILVRRYRVPLHNFVYRFVGDRETSEDIVQETFLRCLRHRRQFPVIEQVSTWLYTIAGNLAKTELRRRKRWHWVPTGPSEDEERTPFYEPVDGEALPGEVTDTRTVHQSVETAIQTLPDEFRDAVLLRDHERPLVRRDRQDHRVSRRDGEVAGQPGTKPVAAQPSPPGGGSDRPAGAGPIHG